MIEDALFEGILDNITSDDNIDSRDKLKKNVQVDNDNTLDERNIPRTDRFTLMMAFMCGLKTGVKPVRGLIKQELDKFQKDCEDILEQTPEVRDYCVCVLTAYEFYEDIDPRIHMMTVVAGNDAGRMSNFRMNFCICWDRPLKNSRTVKLLMQAFNNSLRKCEFMLFDNMCCRFVVDNYWKGKYWIQMQSYDDYMSLLLESDMPSKKDQEDFWNIYNLQRWLCRNPKTFYELRKQFKDFDYSTVIYKHMLWAITDKMRLFNFYGDEAVSEFKVSEDGPVSKLIGTVVGPQILNDYKYAVVCVKPSNTADFNTNDTYFQVSSRMGNEPLQNAVKAQLYARKAIIRKVTFMRANDKTHMCFTLFDPVWVPEGLTMAYLGIVFISTDKETRSLNRIISEMYKSFESKPAVTQKNLYQELINSPLEEKFWPSRN